MAVLSPPTTRDRKRKEAEGVTRSLSRLNLTFCEANYVHGHQGRFANLKSQRESTIRLNLFQLTSDEDRKFTLIGGPAVTQVCLRRPCNMPQTNRGDANM